MTEYAKIENNQVIFVAYEPDEEFIAKEGLQLTDVEKGYDGRWYLAGKAPEKPITKKDYEKAVDIHINAVAQENDFDSILTCTKYAGFDNEFREHAESLLAWNAACWVKCHEVLNAVNAGERTAPTIDELIAELPEY